MSDSTYETDIDPVRGKGYTYARAAIREYLTIDPTGQFIAEQSRGWRLVASVYQSWAPDAEGRWQSEQIAVAIGMEGVMATVYARNGTRQLREGAVAEEVDRLRAEAHDAERLRAEVERLRRLLDERSQ